MAATAVRGASPWPVRIWFAIGAALLIYAVLGNYLVLPGYRRFLEHGSPHAGRSGVDFALIWGAVRTILWLFSFHLGAYCIAMAALIARGRDARAFRLWFAIGGLGWLGFWAIPALPGPYTALFAGGGLAILLAIMIAFGRATANAQRHGSHFGAFRGGHWQIASYFFFALATWDMCGLGSVGGILQPDSAVHAANRVLVATQTSKLVVELALAWGLLAIAAFPGRPADAPQRAAV